jgi:nucleoside-diphosphate-sugar epimerase
MEGKAGDITRSDCARVFPSILDRLDGAEGTTVLVTGGTGYVGSWICEAVSYLNDVHHKNIKLYLVARNKECFETRLAHLAGKPYVHFIRCDVRSLAEVPKEVNYVVHAASNPDFRFHSSNPIETMITISEGTSAVLRAVDRASDLRMFLNLSSSSVYSAQLDANRRIPESFDGLSLAGVGKHPFAEAKRYAEALCASARGAARIPIVTVRPFTFLGAYQDIDAPWAINNFMRDALAKRPIRILGDGQTTRSFMYGADVAAWILVMLLRAKSGQTYNLGCDTGHTLLEVARKVALCVEPNPEVVTNASLTGAVQNSCLVPETTSAQRDFGLQQYTSLDLAIARTMAWYKCHARM